MGTEAIEGIEVNEEIGNTMEATVTASDDVTATTTTTTTATSPTVSTMKFGVAETASNDTIESSNMLTSLLFFLTGSAFIAYFRSLPHGEPVSEGNGPTEENGEEENVPAEENNEGNNAQLQNNGN